MSEVRSLLELRAAFAAGLEEQLEDSVPQRALLGALPLENRPLSLGELECLAPPRDEGDTRSTLELVIDAAVESVAQALYYEGLDAADTAVRDVVKSWRERQAAEVGVIGPRGRYSALAES